MNQPTDHAAARKVMIIDDSDLVLESTRLMLEGRGFEVICANTPIGASLVAYRVAPDIILIDLEMASMPGERVVSAFKAKQQMRDIPVLIYSAQPAQRLRAAAASCGADGYIEKTSDVDQLCDALARWLPPPLV